MKKGDRVYGEPGVFFPTFRGHGIVIEIINHEYFGGTSLEFAVVELLNGEKHTVPVSSLIVGGNK